MLDKYFVRISGYTLCPASDADAFFVFGKK